MALFLSGAVFIAGLLSSLFFLIAWRRTRDRFFIFFAISFLLLAIERVLLEMLRLPSESRHEIYITRLVAFMLILIGIADKNRTTRRRVT